ncbi:unnamed protein product [Urochloa humidicola]
MVAAGYTPPQSAFLAHPSSRRYPVPQPHPQEQHGISGKISGDGESQRAGEETPSTTRMGSCPSKTAAQRSRQMAVKALR